MAIRQTIYDRVGGEEGVKRLVNAFCDILETTETGKPVYLLHLRGHGMPHTRVEQVNFLSGFFGGPKLYAEKWGHSNIREIHEHVPIDQPTANAWLTCMNMTLEQLEYEDDLKTTLMRNFSAVADILVQQSNQVTH